jgi:hypothetical protein
MMSIDARALSLLFALGLTAFGCGEAFRRNTLLVGLTGAQIPERVSISAGECSTIALPATQDKENMASTVCDTKDRNPVISVTCAGGRLPEAKLHPNIQGDSNKFIFFHGVCEKSAQEIENENARAKGRQDTSWGVSS